MAAGTTSAPRTLRRRPHPRRPAVAGSPPLGPLACLLLFTKLSFQSCTSRHLSSAVLETELLGPAREAVPGVVAVTAVLDHPAPRPLQGRVNAAVRRVVGPVAVHVHRLRVGGQPAAAGVVRIER